MLVGDKATFISIGSDASTSARFKIKATKTGYITVGIKEYGYDTSTGYVTLLNSKKKTVSGKVYYSDSKTSPSAVVFGVKKGTTYYYYVKSMRNKNGKILSERSSIWYVPAF